MKVDSKNYMKQTIKTKLNEALIKEYLSQDMVSLKKYFSLTYKEKVNSLPNMFPNYFKDFLIEGDVDFEIPYATVDSDGEGIDEYEDYELIEILERKQPEMYYKYGEYLTWNNY
jgi:hypothetical protein